MSMTGPERDQFAAEAALGVLDADERARAVALAASDPAFAAEVERWHERLAPLLAEIAPAEPSAGLWRRINDALDSADERPGNVVQLQQRVHRWQAVAAALSAVAAALLILVAVQPTRTILPPPAPEAKAEMLMANVAAADKSAAFVVAIDAAHDSMMVTPAVASPAAGHDHQLWLVPASGKPKSLGIVSAKRPMRMAVDKPMMPMLKDGAMLAISVEPVGGSPTGQPTGPVVATGPLVAV